jgi:hypothetical protein
MRESIPPNRRTADRFNPLNAWRNAVMNGSSGNLGIVGLEL